MNEKAKWTFMVYLAGDNNLSTAGDQDLTEMRAVGSTAEVNILVEFDNEGDRGTNRYHIQQEGVDDQVQALGETDSGDPKTLLNFVAWAAEEYPAERYALILWNHGGGWEPSEIDRIAKTVKATDYNTREASERSATPLGRALFRTTLETIFNIPAIIERAICTDDGSGHSLDTIELGKVLGKTMEILDQPLDLLGMDACLMSNLEVAYQIRPYAQYMVASEESEPNDGWPYTSVLRELVTDPDQSTADLAAHIVGVYIHSYLERGYTGPITQSAFDLIQIDKVVERLNALANAITDNLPSGAMEIWNAQRKSAHFWHNTLWDIAHFCEVLAEGTANQGIREACEAVREILSAGQGKFVLAEAHNGTKVEHCGGVTIYLIPPLMNISRFYGDLAYAKDQSWLNMLHEYNDV